MDGKITFILPTRNDCYSCSGPQAWEEQKKKILLPILSSKMSFPGSKFIVVEYCPYDWTPRVAEVISHNVNGVSVVTVGNNIDKHLKEDIKVKGTLNFYEHVAKHIGVILAKTKYVCVLNQDVILPEENVGNLLNALENGNVCLAKKCKIPYDAIERGVFDILSGVRFKRWEYTEVGLWGNGDFLMLSKEKYFEMGGLLLAHQNWAIDNEILFRNGLVDMHTLQSRNPMVTFSRPYEIVCLDHKTDGLERPFVQDTSDPYGRTAQLISPWIRKNINDLFYVEDVVTL